MKKVRYGSIYGLHHTPSQIAQEYGVARITIARRLRKAA
jgi:hypothetical protein